ncbi:hypothetical protein FY534_14285 (plasmid) [Alicyclobacillus sp. TC]|uniref:hypothetical protein n=1 Tax=Alicyclobacillus sp. TC TaxID=2606450 RepID=UPI0019311DD2|nr:hypothetical protein [Alicyclobacillus sp. TC]QRF24938.1 hypothetical protein FY534_14285 [Alicyclobacillus sp. TC]
MTAEQALSSSDVLTPSYPSTSSQTHKALIAYTRCAEMLENEEDQKRLEQVSLLLAEQAKVIQDELLGYALYWGRGRGHVQGRDRA